eukprot:1768120-Pleurochrysis_carterae.AAC.1
MGAKRGELAFAWSEKEQGRNDASPLIPTQRCQASHKRAYISAHLRARRGSGGTRLPLIALGDDLLGLERRAQRRLHLTPQKERV